MGRKLQRYRKRGLNPLTKKEALRAARKYTTGLAENDQFFYGGLKVGRARRKGPNAMAVRFRYKVLDPYETKDKKTPVYKAEMLIKRKRKRGLDAQGVATKDPIRVVREKGRRV